MRSEPETTRRALDALPTVGLASLWLLTLAALAGYATFGLHPGLLARFPGSAEVYGVAFPFFAQAQVLLATAVMLLFLSRHTGGAWVPAFAAIYALSLGSELLGTTAGVPFGDYAYTEGLGPKWFDHVPVLIPASWFFMALPSWALAWAALPGRKLERVLLASALLVTWDLALDPAMSFGTSYWVWADPGVYYGMPWLNLAGWWVTGGALMLALEGLGAGRWVGPLPVRWLASFYAVNVLLPLGMSAAAGLWWAVAATLAALVAATAFVRVLGPAPAAFPGVVGVAS